MGSRNLKVNVRDGFLPHFTPGYLDRYGPTSELVYAVADHYTLNLASIMKRSGERIEPCDIARHADDTAIAALRELIQGVEAAKKSFFQEAHGAAPLGSKAKAEAKDAAGKRWQMWLVFWISLLGVVSQFGIAFAKYRGWI